MRAQPAEEAQIKCQSPKRNERRTTKERTIPALSRRANITLLRDATRICARVFRARTRYRHADPTEQRQAPNRNELLTAQTQFRAATVRKPPWF